MHRAVTFTFLDSPLIQQEKSHNPMSNELNTHKQNSDWIKKILFVLGAIFVIVGIVRQWPLVGKTYMEFIEGKGYLALMLGLIMIVLGFSVSLLIGDEEEES